ncbi:trypsin-like cysteine/serine peptidase domain-containing protein [Aspergillus pseudodeflectus]|uniref:Serine protease n=1 Tax=Aspergillus pseudodeflectus TaxID=176178 RepID=A0ABR4LEP8_9EURO
MSIIAGTWDLNPSSPAPAELKLYGPTSHEDSILLLDERIPVSAEDIQPGGKYRSIAKLFIRYAGQEPEDTRYAMATGWLIRDDILVTAGHCAFDWTLKDAEGLGRAVEVKAYIGYHGKASVNDDAFASGRVQFRYGVKVVTTEGWLKGGTYRNNDVAFIQLNRPFDDVTPLEYQSTPLRGSEVIGVVGYPADRIYNEESGGQMYEEFRQTRWNLDHSAGKLLEYRMNTFRGQTGAPVLLKSNHASIGTHVYGGSEKNAASVIGEHGNPYAEYISVFDRSLPEVTPLTPRPGVTYVEIQATDIRGANPEEES